MNQLLEKIIYLRCMTLLLRKNYLPPLYETTLESIRSDIGENCVRISVDDVSIPSTLGVICKDNLLDWMLDIIVIYIVWLPINLPGLGA